jgi:ribosomal protein L11 methyltransferase
MSWWVIDVGFDATHDSDRIASLLVRETGQTVEERDDRVIGSAQSEEQARAAAVRMTAELGPGITIAVAPAAPVDWAGQWRDGLAVRTIGRLRIGPSWLLEPGPLAVVIDPEMAFGTGEHGSTRGALTLLDQYVRPGDIVLDLGSGSGILTIAAAKLGCRRGLGIEADPEALPAALANRDRNRETGRVEFLEGDAAMLAPLAAPVDLVVSNILREVNATLLGPIRRALAPEGIAIFAGMEEAEAPLFRPALDVAGFRVEQEQVDEGWWAVAARPDTAAATATRTPQ